MTSGAPIGFLVLCFFLTSCARVDAPLPSPTFKLPFDRLKKTVSGVRGLAFERDVYPDFQSSEKIQAALRQSLFEDYGEAQLAQMTQVYQRLGLLPGTVRLDQALLEFRRLEQTVRYDVGRKAVILPQEPVKVSAPFLPPHTRPASGNALQFLSVQALTRALLEQHFHLDEMLRYARPQDGRLALQALVQGDGVLVELKASLGDEKETAKKLLSEIQAIAAQSARVDTELTGLPDLFRQKLIFRYLHGSQFALWAYMLKGWDGVNALYSRPPRSTAQILHPEKYYAKRQDPLRVIPWRLLRSAEESPIVEETLGEFLTRFLLSTALSKEEAARIAASWRGDTLLAFQQGDKLAVGWVTAWEDPAKAKEFYRAYQKTVEKRLGFALQAQEGTLLASPANAPAVLLQVRENFVFYLDGLAPPRSLGLAEEFWKELETLSDSIPIPYDLGRLAAHSRSTPK